MPTVRLPELELNVIDEGSGPVLLLVHGFPLDHSMWTQQISAFRHSHRVLAPDLRGFGRSTGVTDTFTMEQLADDLAAMLSALQISEPITLGGLSMGGYVAWQFWRRHRAQLARLIVCDSRAAADTAEAARGRLDTATQVLRDGPAKLVDGMLPKLFAPATLERQDACVEATRQVMLQTNPAAIAAALRGMAERPDVTAELPQIDLPTLVVCGEHDAISKVDEMRTIAAALPRATFAEIAGAGHMAPLEDAAAVNAAIETFLHGD